jgi:hypothetical protein
MADSTRLRVIHWKSDGVPQLISWVFIYGLANHSADTSY